MEKCAAAHFSMALFDTNSNCEPSLRGNCASHFFGTQIIIAIAEAIFPRLAESSLIANS